MYRYVHTHTHRGNVLHVFTCVLHVFTCVDYHWKNEKTGEKRERTKRVRRNFFFWVGGHKLVKEKDLFIGLMNTT